MNFRIISYNDNYVSIVHAFTAKVYDIRREFLELFVSDIKLGEEFYIGGMEIKSENKEISPFDQMFDKFVKKFYNTILLDILDEVSKVAKQTAHEIINTQNISNLPTACCKELLAIIRSSAQRPFYFRKNLKEGGKFCPFCGKELNKSLL